MRHWPPKLPIQFAHLTAQSSREISLLQADAVELFVAASFLAETIKVTLETKADQLGEVPGNLRPQITSNQELDAIRKCARR
jgi:hypothetical protein